MKTLSITAAAAGLSSWLSYCSWHRHCISLLYIKRCAEWTERKC